MDVAHRGYLPAGAYQHRRRSCDPPARRTFTVIGEDYGPRGRSVDRLTGPVMVPAAGRHAVATDARARGRPGVRVPCLQRERFPDRDAVSEAVSAYRDPCSTR